MIRAIVINPVFKTVFEIRMKSSLHEMESRLGGRIDVAFDFPNGDVCYISKSAANNRSGLSFLYDKKSRTPFPGWGLIIGRNRNTFTNVKTPVAQIRRQVSFPGDKDVSNAHPATIPVSNF